MSSTINWRSKRQIIRKIARLDYIHQKPSHAVEFPCSLFVQSSFHIPVSILQVERVGDGLAGDPASEQVQALP